MLADEKWTMLIVKSTAAFVPEAHAYKYYLEDRGWLVNISNDNELDAAECLKYDVVLRFGGLLKFNLTKSVPEIHEYHSASTGRFARVKNVIKSWTPADPSGLIFLNHFVQTQFRFSRGIPYIHRDMGVSEKFFSAREGHRKDYDLVYAGSLRRTGFLKCVAEVAHAGYSIAIAGVASREVRDFFKWNGITYVGKLDYDDVPSFLASGWFGLDYRPHIYPQTRQTSTKALEYLALGLPIVSNQYQWIDSHARRNGYRYIDLSELVREGASNDLDKLTLAAPETRKFSWDNVLQEAGFEKFVTGVITDHLSFV